MSAGALLVPATRLLAGGTVSQIVDPTARAAAINSIRQTLLAAAAGIVAALGLVATFRTYMLARRAQYSDRYAKAVTLLGADRLDGRVGAVFALEQLARESVLEQQTITNVLVAFVRRRALLIESEILQQNTPTRMDYGQAEDRADIQAALTVLARRRVSGFSEDRLDLSRVDLRGLKLQYARLENANISSSALHDADLTGAMLKGADLSGSCLVRANLRGASLEQANLDQANLDWADANDANFKGARLAGTKLENIDLSRTKLR